jgi:hypothetical protein
LIAILQPGESLTAVLAGAPATTNPNYAVQFNDAATPNYPVGLLNGATAVTVVPAPSQYARLVASFLLFNADTAAVVVTIAKLSGGVSYTLASVTVPVGARLEWTDMGLRVITSSGQVQSTTADLSVAGVASGAGVVATEYSAAGGYHKTVLSLTNLSLTTTDHTTNGAQGSQVVYTFPKGAVQLLGASCNLTTARVGTNIQTTAALVGSLGSVAAAITDATLTSTEADMIASIAGTLVAGAGTLNSYGGIVTTPFNGTATATVANLNVAIPDAGSAGNDALLVNGTITLYWADLTV